LAKNIHVFETKPKKIDEERKKKKDEAMKEIHVAVEKLKPGEDAIYDYDFLLKLEKYFKHLCSFYKMSRIKKWKLYLIKILSCCISLSKKQEKEQKHLNILQLAGRHLKQVCSIIKTRRDVPSLKRGSQKIKFNSIFLIPIASSVFRTAADIITKLLKVHYPENKDEDYHIISYGLDMEILSESLRNICKESSINYRVYILGDGDEEKIGIVTKPIIRRKDLMQCLNKVFEFTNDKLIVVPADCYGYLCGNHADYPKLSIKPLTSKSSKATLLRHFEVEKDQEITYNFSLIVHIIEVALQELISSDI
jgi:hypothetical protein